MCVEGGVGEQIPTRGGVSGSADNDRLRLFQGLGVLDKSTGYVIRSTLTLFTAGPPTSTRLCSKP